MVNRFCKNYPTGEKEDKKLHEIRQWKEHLHRKRHIFIDIKQY